MRLLTAAVSAVLIALLGFLAGLFTWGRDLPDVQDLDVLEFSGRSRVYDRNGELVGTLSPSLANGYSVNRTLLKLGQISPWVQKAVVTSEDRRFYQHGGVDFIGIGRGLLRGLTGDLEGGSSITQQVVNNTLLADLGHERTARRKFREAILAFQVERQFGKDQILTAYLNVIYWGDGGRSDIVGIAGAARAYLNKPASDLNLAESVYLATIIPSPNKRYRDYAAYRALMRSLLDRMVEDGRATRAQADAAWRYPLQPAGWQVRYDGRGNVTSARLSDAGARARQNPAPPPQPAYFYMQALERELIAKVGRTALYTGGGVRVTASLDLAAQRAAERASLDARLPDGATLGMAFMDPRNGDVLALVGQKLDGGRPAEWNNATQAQRQVGSSIKPLLYTTALSTGVQQSDRVLDAPLTGDYQPKNYDGRWTGRRVTLRYALDHSLNLPTVRLAQQVGLNTFQNKLQELGLSVPDNAGLSLAIGTLEASPLQMAAAYVPFANGGLYFDPVLVKEVRKGSQLLYSAPQNAGRRVWDEQTAWLGLDMIRGVVNDLTPAQGGLGWRARVSGWPVGGKTGTTNDVKDLWFAGVTPRVAGAVWVGKQEGGAMPRTAYSGEVAAPVWQAAVSGALAGKPVAPFQQPAGIEYRWVRGVNMAFKPQAQPGGLAGFFRPRPAPAPVDPAPDPAPVAAPAPAPEPAPVEPTPEPTPAEPAPVDPAPVPNEPTPSEPVPTEPVPAPDPVPAEPAPAPDPAPAPIEPAPPAPLNPDEVPVTPDQGVPPSNIPPATPQEPAPLPGGTEAPLDPGAQDPAAPPTGQLPPDQSSGAVPDPNSQP